MNPKISIITVCYNAAHLLTKTVESVLEQTYINLEYIIVDGKSTDNTSDLVLNFQPKIHLFISESDNGLYDAMNKGIANAKGDYILFLNAGDYLVSKDVIDFYLTKLQPDKADIFFARIVWNDVLNKNIVLSDNSKTLNRSDLRNLNFPHSATLYKRNMFSKIGLFNLKWKILADYEWNARAFMKFNINFQYVDIIVTVFFTDGISNNKENEQVIKNETTLIHEKYFLERALIEKNSRLSKAHLLKRISRKLIKSAKQILRINK